MTLPIVNLVVKLKKTRFTREVLFWFNFCLFMLVFSERIDSHVSLPCFFSIWAIAPLIIYFDLRLKNVFSKITISLFYYSIFVFKILRQIFLLINSLSVLRNLISVKVLLPTMSNEYNHLKKD